MQMEHLKKGIMGKMTKACLNKPKKKRRTCVKGESRETVDRDGYIERSFEVMFIFDNKIAQVNT